VLCVLVSFVLRSYARGLKPGVRQGFNQSLLLLHFATAALVLAGVNASEKSSQLLPLQ
jgi:hypothetical protein